MDSIKYVGMDVHKETVSIAVRNQAGKNRDGDSHRDESERDPRLASEGCVVSCISPSKKYVGRMAL